MNGSANFSGISSGFDENLIVNTVRARKKNSELPCCPVCSCTIRANELQSHFTLELERLNKVTLPSTGKRKLSNSSSGVINLSMPGSSSNVMDDTEETVDVTGCTGSDVYQRVRTNRTRRLRRSSARAAPAGECPVCGARLPLARLERHAARCGAPDAAASSEEEGSIDVENDDSPSEGGSFGVEYRWCGQWRVRAAALQASHAPPQPRQARRVSQDTSTLVVDGDEDTELYGPPQYSPSSIAPHADEHMSETPLSQELGVDLSAYSEDTGGEGLARDGNEKAGSNEERGKDNGLIEGSAAARIAALSERVRELEARRAGDGSCLICLGAYTAPAVSVQCWHVYCEQCWLESLRAKKICPQCNAITSAHHLRRIYI